MLEIATVNIKY